MHTLHGPSKRLDPLGHVVGFEPRTKWMLVATTPAKHSVHAKYVCFIVVLRHRRYFNRILIWRHIQVQMVWTAGLSCHGHHRQASLTCPGTSTDNVHLFTVQKIVYCADLNLSRAALVLHVYVKGQDHKTKNRKEGLIYNWLIDNLTNKTFPPLALQNKIFSSVQCIGDGCAIQWAFFKVFFFCNGATTTECPF